MKNNFAFFVVLLALLAPVKLAGQADVGLDSLIKWVSENGEKNAVDSSVFALQINRAVALATTQNEALKLAKIYREKAYWLGNDREVDSSLFYLKKAEEIYTAEGDDEKLASTYLAIEAAYRGKAEFAQSSKYAFSALSLFEKMDDKVGVANCYTEISNNLYYQAKYELGADYNDKAIALQKTLNVPEDLSLSYRYKADNLLQLERYEEARLCVEEAIAVLKAAGKPEYDLMPAYNTLANIYKFMGRYSDAIFLYKKNYVLCTEIELKGRYSVSLANIGHVYILQENYEAALPYILDAIKYINLYNDNLNLYENYLHAALCHEKLGNLEEAIRYKDLCFEVKVKEKNEIIRELESELRIKYESAKKDETIVVQDATIDRQRSTQLAYLGIAGLLAVILFGMYFTMKNIRKKREELATLNAALEENKNDLEKSLQDLKLAQNQLVQSEKMASLGELTAGIAHEIQNPLNFVNNFSEISGELVDEMVEEIDKGDIHEAKAIAADVRQNLEKITHHGKRADIIVKGMLQHSRKSSGTKIPTRINALADEYFKLAYHGLRAKDKGFNATLHTDFDENIGKVMVIAEDIGRVILNLFTNAFYAVSDKQKEGVADYKPTVSVRTESAGGKINIIVQDNGNGIPDEVLNKIFQPFFTTKPAGKGTGLGLSLAYDIVQVHGGELLVDTKQGEGTTFTIALPNTKA